MIVLTTGLAKNGLNFLFFLLKSFRYKALKQKYQYHNHKKEIFINYSFEEKLPKVLIIHVLILEYYILDYLMTIKIRLLMD